MTSNVKTKNTSKGGINIELNEHYSDEILNKNDIQMDLVMQVISSAKSVRNDTMQDIKEFNNQSLTTETKKGEQLVSLMPAIKKAFNLLGDDIIELSTENGALKNKIGSYDG